MNGVTRTSFFKGLAATSLAVLLTACGSGGSNNVGTPLPPVYTQSDLSGSYVYTVKGTDPNDGDYAITGSFTADGKGAITTAVADYNLGSGVDANVPLTGTYTVSNGVATIMLTDSGAIQESYFVPVVKTGTAVLTRYDGTGSGTLYVPAAGFTPAGSYTFNLSGEDEGTAMETGSFVAAASGTFASGTESFTDSSVLMSYASLTGFLSPVDPDGRGQAAIGGGNFSYYVAGPNQILLLGLDDRALLQGTATKQ